jgi:uncharacterized membrane protein required for colicin V production
MSNTNYIDVAVFLILIIEFFIGIRSGVILILFDILSIVAGWFAAKAFALKFASFLDKQFTIVAKLSRSIGSVIHIPDYLAKLPATKIGLNQTFSILNLPDFLKNFIVKNFAVNLLNIQSYIDIKLATLLLNGIAFAIIFIATVIIVRIVGIIIRRMIKVTPFLNWIDAVFGGLFKIILVAVVIAIVAQAIVYIFSFFNVTQKSFLGEVLNSRFYGLSIKILPQVAKTLTNIISGTH